MTDQETNKRLRELASRIAEEKDHDTFTKLVAEFNQILEGQIIQSSGDQEKPKS